MYYGERLKDYPFKVAIKMLVSRFMYVSCIPIILPEMYILKRYFTAKMYFNIAQGPIEFDMAFGVYEYWKTKLFFELVKPGMTILDIGACRGNYSILFANLMNDKGKVLAFEPEPDNCYRIGKNVQVNNYRCIEIHQCALSDNEGSATFYKGVNNGLGYGVGSLIFDPHWNSSEEESITVQTRRLDNFLDEEHINDVDIIKIDVQGNDIAVLKGAEHTLRNSNVILLMDVDVTSESERKELFDILSSCGFKIYRIGKELTPINEVTQLLLLNRNNETKFNNTHQIVREIYATKPK
jgi:FkbM family methyltransferase